MPFGGIPIVVDSYLVGSRTAIKRGGSIHVSPAMFDLMRHANERELQQLCENLNVVDVDPPQPDPEAQVLRMLAGMKRAGVDVPKLYRDFGLPFPPIVNGG